MANTKPPELTDKLTVSMTPAMREDVRALAWWYGCSEGAAVREAVNLHLARRKATVARAHEALKGRK